MSMDDMLYDAARDAAAEKADEVRDEVMGEIRDLESRVDLFDGRLDDIDGLRLDDLRGDLDALDANVLKVDEVDERLTAHPTHIDLDAQIDRINALERNLQGFDNVADCNQIADLNVRVNELTDMIFDRAGSASRQHFIDTGRYLTHAEVAEDDEVRAEYHANGPSWATPINAEQRRTIFGALKAVGWNAQDSYARRARLDAVNAVLIGHGEKPIDSFRHLSEAQADLVLSGLLMAQRIKEALA